MEGRGKGEKTEPRRAGDPGQGVGDPAGRFPDPGVRGRFCPPEAVLAWRLSSDGRQGAFLNRWRGCGMHDGKGDGGNGRGGRNWNGGKRTPDGVHSTPGHGVRATAGGGCTLRAAIQEAVVSVLASARAGAETATKHEPETSPYDRATGARGDRFRRVGGAGLQPGGPWHPGDEGRI